MAPAFFPQPYSDEIMYGLISRYHHISGNIYNNSSMVELFNMEGIVPSIALQTRLGVLANNTEMFGADFDTFPLNNTMFPYLMLFTPPEIYARVYQWAKFTENRTDRFAVGATHRNMYPEMMMYCPECYNEEILSLGEGYWRRIHQTPGIFVCKKHRCHLLSSLIPTFCHKQNSFQIISSNVIQANTNEAPNRCFDYRRHYNIHTCKWRSNLLRPYFLSLHLKMNFLKMRNNTTYINNIIYL